MFNANATRAILANAHAAWIATSKNPKVDALHNLKQSLVEADYMELTDGIENVSMLGTSIQVTIDTYEDYVECIEIDAYGNVLRGKPD